MIYLIVWALGTFMLYGAIYTLFNSNQAPRVLPFLGQISGFAVGWCITQLIKINPLYWWLLVPTLAPVIWLICKEYRKHKASHER